MQRKARKSIIYAKNVVLTILDFRWYLLTQTPLSISQNEFCRALIFALSGYCMAILLEVNAQESGLKLFAFLRRCLLNEDAELYRWIRTGQVRINSGRAKSTSRVCVGDFVRLPPFAISALSANKKYIENKEQKALDPIVYNAHNQKILIPRIFENENLLIINKPAGLASQGGTGQSHNLVEILKHAYQNSRFIPAPAHRLDKNTSGLMCVGKSYTALRFLSDFMQEEISNAAHLSDNRKETKSREPARKEYLAWVHGNSLAINAPFFMENYIYFDEKKEKMNALDLNSVSVNHENGKAKYALSQVTCLKHCGAYSLLKVGIFTGRKHQIRVQCAHLGFPLLGDMKYGRQADRKNSKESALKLHAYRLNLPINTDLYHENLFEVLPDWDEEWSVSGIF